MAERTGSWTPGPWEMQARDSRERGIAIIAVNTDVPKGGTPTRGMVAWVGQGGANFGKPLEQAANARLIASAPDLLEALRAVEAHHAELNAKAGRDESRSLTLKLVRAGLAKADGRDPA